MKQYFLLIILFFLSAIAVHAQADNALSGTNRMIKSELYFGMDIKGKSMKKKQWKAFVNEYLVPNFATGITVLNAGGWYLNSATNNMITEQTKIVVIVHEDSRTEKEKIFKVTRRYCELFQQESVLWISTDMKNMQFIGTTH